MPSSIFSKKGDGDSQSDREGLYDENEYEDDELLPVYGEQIDGSPMQVHELVHRNRRMADLVTKEELKLRPHIFAQYIYQRRQYARKSGEDEETSSSSHPESIKPSEKGSGIVGAGDAGESTSTRESGRLIGLFKSMGKSKGKSKETHSKVAENEIMLYVDTGRVYWPGQEVQAVVRIPEAYLEDGLFEEVVCELKGEIRTFAVTTDGQGNQLVHVKTQTMFKNRVTVFGGGGENETTHDRDDLSEDVPFSSLASISPFTGPESEIVLSSGRVSKLRAWCFSSTLPQTYTAQVKHSETECPLPPTFRGRGLDHRSNWVLYCVKVTGKKRGIKRNFRRWIPIFVMCFDLQENLLTIPRTLAPPVKSSLERHNLSDPTVWYTPPPGWSCYLFGQKLKKNVLKEKGTIMMALYFPDLSKTLVSEGTSSRIPFILQVQVFAKLRESLLPAPPALAIGNKQQPQPGGSNPSLEEGQASSTSSDPSSSNNLASAESILPTLPCIGAGENHPHFVAKRTEWSKAAGISETTVSHFKVGVEWDQGHLLSSSPEREAGAGVTRDETLADTIANSTSYGWTNPVPFTPTDTLPSSDSSGEVASAEAAPIDFQPTHSQTRFFFPHSAPTKPETKKSHEYHVTRCSLSGRIKTTDLSPTIETSHLKTSYRIDFRWNMNNQIVSNGNLKESICDFRVGTGVIRPDTRVRADGAPPAPPSSEPAQYRIVRGGGGGTGGPEAAAAGTERQEADLDFRIKTALEVELLGGEERYQKLKSLSGERFKLGGAGGSAFHIDEKGHMQ